MWDLDSYSFCISINKKRFEYLTKNFHAVGLRSPCLFNGVRWNRGSNSGCVLAHLSVLNMARNLKLPYCLVLEDDAYPRPDILDVWDKIKNNIPEDCGLLKLGSSSYRGERVFINEYIDIMKTGTAFGSHAYFIREDLYSRLITTMLNLNVPDVAMNLEYYIDKQYKPYVLNFDYQLFIQKNISIDNIISNKGGQRYWYPDKEKGFGCTSGLPCEHFVDKLIPDDDNYLEQLSVIKYDKWIKGRKTGVVTDDLLYTKDEDGKLTQIDKNIYLIHWRNGLQSKLFYNGQKDGINFYTIKEI